MKKSLLCWGALIVVALCFVGCCYYNTTHCTPCKKHCSHTPCCNEAGKKCPDASKNNDDTVETMTVEAVEIVPMQNNNAPGNNASAPAAQSQTTAPAGAANTNSN